MNSVFVYCEIEDGQIAEVSQELLTKGKGLANELNCKLEAIAIGHKLDNIGNDIFPYGVDVLYVADDKRLAPFSTLPHTSIVVKLFQEQKPQIALMGASSVGRDLGHVFHRPFTAG